MDLPVIHAFNESSEMGMDTFSPAIFLEDCNFRCGYCMNAKLVRKQVHNVIELDFVINYLKENNCKWLNIGGGEPTLTQKYKLLNLIKTIKDATNVKVGLSTNGSIPGTLAIILQHLDYVALDIKSFGTDMYSKFGPEFSFNNVLTTKGMLMATKTTNPSFNYEIRTTLYPEFITERILHQIGGLINMDETWILQQFRHTKEMLNNDARKVTPFNDEELKDMLSIARNYSPKAELRYV